MQFGKQLLSKGDFEPYYYAFYDDDIIYDNEYTGLTNETGSNQNKVEERIKDVPRTRTQHAYTGIETEIQKNNMLIRSGEILEDGKAVFVGKQDPNQKRFEVKNDRNFSSYNFQLLYFSSSYRSKQFCSSLVVAISDCKQAGK